MRNETLKAFLFWFVVLAFALMVNSCGSTKKRLQEQSSLIQNESLVRKEQSELQELNVKIETSKVTDAVANTIKIKKTYTPILPDKKAVAIDSQGKRVELENASLVEETTLHQDKEQVRQAGKSEAVETKGKQAKEVGKSKAIEKAKEQDKIIDRKAIHFSVWIWLILVAVVVLVVTYLKYRFKWIFNVTGLLNK